jgi:type VI secretion system protein ImpA
VEQVIDVKTLIAPIPGENPAGEDLSFSNEFDAIKEARRSEENLAQGEWEREIKAAEWPKVRQMTTELLETRTKDLQLAAWLTEAASHLHGCPGLCHGLTLTRELIANFWGYVYPSIEDGPAMRAGKISWLNSNLPAVIEIIPLTAQNAGAYALRQWNEAKDVDNLGRKDPAAMKRAVDEGKLTSEVFNKAVADTPETFYEGLYAEIMASQDAFKLLEKQVEVKFGDEAPSLAAVRETIENCVQIITRIAKEKGMLGGPVTTRLEPEITTDPAVAQTTVRAGSREEALRKLIEAAHYFKANEPHSPVGFLIDRAANWGRMTFDEWLREVLTDETQLQSVRKLLGMKAPEGE